MKDTTIDWAKIRAHLASIRGEVYWRSLEELADTEAFKELLKKEFPQGASELADPVRRREFLSLAAASLALAGLSACTRQPAEKILPYVQPSEEIVPGEPLYFASATGLQGMGIGVLVESHTGRPTKIEGNEKHPASLGASDVLTQASVLGLYDPDRSQVVRNAGAVSTWDRFVTDLAVRLDSLGGPGGEGMRILTQSVSSPTLVAQIRELLDKYPNARWHHYEPIPRDSVWEGARLAFGTALEPQYRIDRAEVILSLDADFLSQGPGHLRYARQFSAGRRVTESSPRMNRLYAVEPTPSLTGAAADHRLPLPAHQIDGLARAVARKLGVSVSQGNTSAPEKWVEALARDLQSHRGTSLIIPGEYQPPSVHVLAHAMNDALGNVGETVVYTDPVVASPAGFDRPLTQTGSLQSLVDEMREGRVELLLILEGNPVYGAPADLEFAEAMSRVAMRIHLGLYDDETANLCHWHIPQAHYLESWGDIRAFDGTVSIVQPLIEPLYGGKATHEVLSAFLGRSNRSAYDTLREYWMGRGVAWERALHDGLMAETAFEPRSLPLRSDLDSVLSPPATSARDLEIIFRPDPTVFDGRFANNGWLQELPKPLTKITWENAAHIDPEFAERMNLQNGDVVELTLSGRTVEAPVWILPGQAKETVTVHLGYGRSRLGKVGAGIGFNAYLLRGSDALWNVSGLEVRKTGERKRLASTQNHQVMEGRHLIREATLAEFREHADFARELGHDPDESVTLYPAEKRGGYAWGMVIDLNACTGCNACLVACQSENNIPVVGKAEVSRGREMNWIRIDQYNSGDPENPRTSHQPVPCMHCENAPCEPVCPVGATTHSPEGLNEMVYNRCVGTRYCSNNCPYKVRRFNFLQYADFETPVTKLLANPDVTVRARGVMEKCTYCVQRINVARIQAKKEDRTIGDGEITTACQAVCPAEAITFGDINDPDSRVSRLKADPRNYGILTELNVRPRTTYLAKVRNRNPELEER